MAPWTNSCLKFFLSPFFIKEKEDADSASATQAFKALQEERKVTHQVVYYPYVSLEERQFPQSALFTAGCNFAWMAGWPPGYCCSCI